MKKKQKINKIKPSTSKGVLFSFILAATTAGFAFGALIMSYSFPINLFVNNSSYNQGAKDTLSELLAIGAFGKEEIRNISGEVFFIKNNEITFKVFSLDSMPKDLQVRTAVLTPETNVLIKKKKTPAQIASDEALYNNQLGELNKKTDSLKKDLLACEEAESQDNCSALRNEIDSLFRRIGDVNSEKMSPYTVYNGPISDLKGRINISVVAKEDIILKKTFKVSSVELVELGE